MENAKSKISLATALRHIQDVAQTNQQMLACETVPLHKAAGRIAQADYRSALSTPKYDTSAMDGYAISSAATAGATAEKPVAFVVADEVLTPATTRMADMPVSMPLPNSDESLCITITTGARFPDADSSLGQHLDACVKVEDVVVTERFSAGCQRQKVILVAKPVEPRAHRRMAGCDLRENQVLVSRGQLIQSSHIMALASARVTNVDVSRRIRVGIWSTGTEYMSGDSEHADINGPFLTCLLEDYGCQVSFLGYLDDDANTMTLALQTALRKGNCDMLVTSGGVSAGVHDYVAAAVQSCQLLQNGKRQSFHGVNIRPGGPVLFAPELVQDRNQQQRPVFFGLPGNPGAAAACFRFLVVPYLRHLQGRAAEKPITAKAVTDLRENGHRAGTGAGRDTELSIIITPKDCDRFYPGVLRHLHNGSNAVLIDTSFRPSGVRSFIDANCWVHIHARQEVSHADPVDCYMMSSCI